MKHSPERLRIPSPTVLQLMKLVVFASVASSCLAFGVRLSEEGVRRGTPLLIPILEALFLPLALALVAFPLLKKGQFKDWFILLMVAISLSGSLGVGILATFEEIRNGLIARRQPPLDFSELVIPSILLILLSLGLYYLSRKIIPAHCPDCRSFSLLPEARFRARAKAGQGRTHQCFRCHGQFQKRQGRWQAITEEPSWTRSIEG